jgi:hypothetical protein
MRIPRLSSLIFGRGWVLLLPVLLALSWHRVDELRETHERIWNLTSRYFSVQSQMRQIRADAMSRVKKESSVPGRTQGR